MTDKEKAEMFDRIQQWLWTVAAHGALNQSVMAAMIVRELEIPGPDGEHPDRVS